MVNLNTQVEEATYGESTLSLDTLFSEIKVGGKTFKNRIIKSGAGCPSSYDENGYPNEQLYQFYEAIARGGAGYVIVDTNTMPVEALKTVADRVHAAGAAVGMQHYSMSNWMPGGMSSSSTQVLTGSLDFGNPGPTMATTDQVKEVIEEFVGRAEAAYQAGFDGFDINAGCNHFLDNFLSRVYNTERTDEYGPQSLENRARIVTDIIAGIRSRCGKDFVISVLFNAFEVNVYELGDDEKCISLDEGVEFAKLFEAAGADLLHVRWATHGNHAASFFPDRLFICEPGATGYGTVLDFTKGAMGDFEYRYEGAVAAAPIAATIKRNVSIPVGTVGCMDPRLAPDQIEEDLRDGRLDLVMMTRPLIADPDMPNKMQEGRRDEVAPCTHCETCFMDSIGGCRVNPIFGKAGTDALPGGYTYPQVSSAKNVMVIGGGPGGMEAARVSALCGNNVTLYEKKQLGGKMTIAEAVKGNHELLGDYIIYLHKQLDVQGVNVVLGTEVDGDLVRQESPDSVIIAAGADYAAPAVKGLDSSSIVTDIRSCKDCSGRVVLIGHGVQILNIAEYLVNQNCEVTVVNSGPAELLGQYMPAYIQTPTLNWLKAHAVKFYNSATVNEVTDSEVNFTTSYGLSVSVPADRVMYADEAVPSDLISEIKSIVSDTRVVGDASIPANIVMATAAGHMAARGLDYTAPDPTANSSMPKG